MGVKLPQYPPERKPSHGKPQVPPPPPPMNQNSRIAKELIKKIHSGEPCVGVRISVLERLGEIEDAFCNVPLHYSGIQPDTSVAFLSAVELLRKLKTEMEAIT